MTRKISLIVAVAVVALVAVPAAFGEGRLAGSQEPDGVAFFRANEMSTLAQQSAARVSTYRDAHERGGAVVNQSEPQWLKALMARSEGLNKQYGLGEFANTSTVANYRDAHERAVPPTGSEPVSITSTGRDIEWPQIGVGFGIGIVLVLGLILGLKATRNPPLAH